MGPSCSFLGIQTAPMCNADAPRSRNQSTPLQDQASPKPSNWAMCGARPLQGPEIRLYLYETRPLLCHAISGDKATPGPHNQPVPRTT